MSHHYDTQDFWLGSVFLTNANARLINVQVSRNGRETVTFSFAGENLAELVRAYCNGEAQANVTRLRENINLLRDFIFQARQKR